MRKSGEVFRCQSTEKSASQYSLKENEFVLWWSKLTEKGESFLETEEWTNWPPKIPADPRVLGHCFPWPGLIPLSLSLWAYTNSAYQQLPIQHALYVSRNPGGDLLFCKFVFFCFCFFFLRKLGRNIFCFFFDREEKLNLRAVEK